MTKYLYRFSDGVEVELEQRFGSDPVDEMEHPVSGEMEAVDRVPQLFGSKFNGDGWARS